jgi:cytosine/adenosine deaminase-related metal-dependent hydrolase
MADLPECPSPLEVEIRFRDLIDGAGLAQPDKVEHDPEAEELIFRWHEPKLAVVVELSDHGPVGVRRGVLPEPPI